MTGIQMITPSASKCAFTFFISIVLAQSALGVVIVRFVETNSDVVVSFDGTLALDASLTGDTIPYYSSFGGVVESGLILGRKGSYLTGLAGSVSFSGISSVNQLAVVVSDIGYFGFSGSRLYWEYEHISGGVVGAVSELSLSPATASFTLPGQTLASLNAVNIAEDTVVWTATTTGDTIVFSSVAAVPEPTSILLLGLSSLSILRRHRHVI